MSNDQLDYVSFISKDAVVADGKISVPSHLKISGTVKMNIKSNGKVVVTSTGSVEGSIEANEVQVFGKVNGNILSSGGLTLYKDAVVNGQVAALKLIIEEGAICNFDMAVGQDAWSKHKTDFKLGKQRVAANKIKPELPGVSPPPPVTKREPPARPQPVSENGMTEKTRPQEPHLNNRNQSKPEQNARQKEKSNTPSSKEPDTSTDRFW